MVLVSCGGDFVFFNMYTDLDSGWRTVMQDREKLASLSVCSRVYV